MLPDIPHGSATDRQVMKEERHQDTRSAPYKAKEEREKIDPSTQKPFWMQTESPLRRLWRLCVRIQVVSVFDISQTDGKELPDIIVDELSGSVENYAAF